MNKKLKKINSLAQLRINNLKQMKGKSVKIVKSCYQCKGKTVEGKRCQNKISCDKGCHAYCHLHSAGYKNKSNTKCVRK